jgi:hypothetical protein
MPISKTKYRWHILLAMTATNDRPILSSEKLSTSTEPQLSWQQQKYGLGHQKGLDTKTD